MHDSRVMTGGFPFYALDKRADQFISTLVCSELLKMQQFSFANYKVTALNKIVSDFCNPNIACDKLFRQNAVLITV